MDHTMTLTYTTDDDGVHLWCKCGTDVNLGFSTTVKDAVEAQAAHLKEVGA